MLEGRNSAPNATSLRVNEFGDIRQALRGSSIAPSARKPATRDVRTWQQGDNVITFSFQQETKRFDNLPCYNFSARRKVAMRTCQLFLKMAIVGIALAYSCTIPSSAFAQS